MDVIIHPDVFIEKNIVLSDYVDDIKYVKLSDDELFSRIIDIEFSDNYIFISTGEGVLKYDYQGDFINKVGNKGLGPMEYTNCNNFTIDEKSNQLFVRDRQTIKVFDFNGQYLRSIPPIQFGGILDFVIQDEKIYLVSSLFTSPERVEKFWYVIDFDGNLLDDKDNHDVFFERNGMNYFGNFMYKTDDYIGYWNHYNDTIFHIYADKIVPGYIWAEGSYRLTPEKVVSDDASGLISRIIFETNNLLYMHYRYSGKNNICLYDKQKTEFVNMVFDSNNKVGLVNDIDGGLPFNPTQTALVGDDEYFVQILSPDKIFEYISEGGNDTPKQNFDALLKNLSEDDNQIIVMAKLK
jgi:hypothetical protein